MKAGPAADGASTTLNLTDSIEGGDGVDTLTIKVDDAVAAGAFQAATIKNVEVIKIQDLSDANNGSYDLASVTGETKVLTSGSADTAITFTNIDKAAIGVESQNTVSTGATFTFKDSAFAATGTLDVDVNNAGSVTGGFVSTITVGQASGADSAANAVTINATGANNVVLAAGGNAIAAANGIKTLTVTGAGSLTLGATSALVGTTLAADLTKLDASANTGGVTASVSKTTVVVVGGAGNDKITVLTNTLTSGADVNLGAGDDQLLSSGGGAVDANAKVDGGAGTDTVANGLITVANGGIFKNFEKIALSTGSSTTDVELLTGSTISGLLVNTGDITSVVAQNVATGATVEVTAADTSQTGTATIAIKGAAANTADTANVSFNGAAQSATPSAYNIAAGTLTVANVETINI